MKPASCRPFAAVLLALAIPAVASAVTLNADGLGQALIYPYYTVRSTGGNAFNTYLSVVNHADDAKALRVRFREGRNGREALGFNLYLGPGDAWAAAVVPTPTGARLVSADRSCTDPEIRAPEGLEFGIGDFSGGRDDGAGDTADRAREGFVEILEMATLLGASAASVTPRSDGVPSSCPGIRSAAPAVSSPTGGLSGTLTLINVASGLDFTLAADALADLSTQPFFRPSRDPYPGFSATEITPASIVADGRYVYRSTWSRGIDAVSAVLMRSRWAGEYVLDIATGSLTDMVVTMPTRHQYVTRTSASAPFTRAAEWDPACGGSNDFGEPLTTVLANREARTLIANDDFCNFHPCPLRTRAISVCASVAVGSVHNGAEHTHGDFPALRSNVVGSETAGLVGGLLIVASTFQNGWIDARTSEAPAARLVSLPTSQRLDIASGAVTLGPHSFAGLPVTGFTVRTFSNGTLACSQGTCQGNYGGAFPLRYHRSIGP